MFLKKSRLLTYFILIYLFGLVSYWNTFRSEFVFDDSNTVFYQENIKNVSNIRDFWNSYNTRFIPYLSFALNYKIGNLNPVGYHIVNFAIHVLNSFLVFLITKKILNRALIINENNSFTVPFLMGVLFAIHPVQTQAVNFISQRFTLLSAFFYFLTILLYFKKGILFYLFSFVTLICALISKENSYTLFLTLILIESFFFRNRKFADKILRLLPYLLITFTVFSFIYIRGINNPIQTIRTLNMLDNESISRKEYLLTQINVIGTYLRLIILPINKNVDYDFPISKNLEDKKLILPSVVLLSILFAAFTYYKKKPLFTFGIVFFFISLAIESSIIPIKDVIFEHRLYLPSFGIFLALISLITSIKRTRAFYFITAILLTIMIFLTVKRNTIWQSEYSLWKDSALKSPNKARAHYNLGVAAYGINRFEEAKEEMLKTIRLDKDYTDAYLNLSAIYQHEEKNELAIRLMQKRLSDNPKDTKIRTALASFYIKQKNLETGIFEYQKILEYDPDNEKVYNDIGLIFFIQNKKEDAINHFTRAIKINPEYKIALLNLANVYYHFGDEKNARIYYSRLIKLDPEYRDKIPVSDLSE